MEAGGYGDAVVSQAGGASFKIGSRERLIGLTLIGALFVLHVLSYDFLSDDALITLRYSKNLAAGLGLVYNPGDRVEGFTTPLWTVALAGFAALGLDVVLAARLLGMLAGLATIILVYRLFVVACGARSDGEPAVALAPPLVLAANGSFACWAASGMETSLFSLLVVASFLATLTDRLAPAMLATSACLLTRPEGVVVFLMLAAFQLMRLASDRDPRRALWIGGCGAVLVALFVLRRLYFGEWLPNTYYAKTGGGIDQVLRGFRYFLEYCTNHEGVLLVIVPCLYQLLTGDTARRLLAVGVAALWAGAIWEGGDGLPMYRFALASLPLLLVLQADLLEQLATRLMAVQMWPRLRAAVLLVSTVLLWATVHSLRPAIGSQYDLYSYHKEVEVPTWIEVGKWFRDNAPPDATIALVPIGAVGFFSELVVYDMLGLTDHHIAHRSLPHVGSGWAGHEKHDGPYILSRRPTYLLLGNVDVTAAARDPGAAPFIPHATPAIRAREKDLYEVGLDDYVPRSVQLPSGSYLNFYELREASRAAQVVARGEAVPAGAPRAR